MNLARIIEPDLVQPSLMAESKSEAIVELLDLVHRKYPDLDRESILKSIFDREEIENTSYGRGFAFPHARTDKVDKMHVAVGVSKPGIAEETLDGEPLRIICLMLTPRNISKFYLQSLSAFVSLAKDPDIRTSLIQSETSKDLIDTVARSGVTLKKELMVKDVMTHGPICVQPETTLKEVANLLFRNRISGLPVVDDELHIVGVITNRDLIRAAMPDYKSLISNLALTYESEPFENLLKQEDQIRVRELMSTEVFSVEEDTSVVEAAALMLFKDIRHLPVIKNEKLVGLIVISDIVSKIIRG